MFCVRCSPFLLLLGLGDGLAVLFLVGLDDLAFPLALATALAFAWAFALALGVAPRGLAPSATLVKPRG